MPLLISPPLWPPSIPEGARAGCSQELDAGGWSRRRRERSSCTWMQRLEPAWGFWVVEFNPAWPREKQECGQRAPGKLVACVGGAIMAPQAARQVPSQGPCSPVTPSHRDVPILQAAPSSLSLALTSWQRQRSAGCSPSPTPHRHQLPPSLQHHLRSSGGEREGRHKTPKTPNPSSGREQAGGACGYWQHCGAPPSKTSQN